MEYLVKVFGPTTTTWELCILSRIFILNISLHVEQRDANPASVQDYPIRNLLCWTCQNIPHLPMHGSHTCVLNEANYCVANILHLSPDFEMHDHDHNISIVTCQLVQECQLCTCTKHENSSFLVTVDRCWNIIGWWQAGRQGERDKRSNV